MNRLYELSSKVCCRTVGGVLDTATGDFPRVVRLETTNACNARCVICPHRQMRRPMVAMQSDLYARLIDECAVAGCREVHLHNFGEPLLDQRTGRSDRVREREGHSPGEDFFQRIVAHSGPLATADRGGVGRIQGELRRRYRRGIRAHPPPARNSIPSCKTSSRW